MVILILGFIASLIPSIALFIWFRSLKSDQLYKDSCKKAFIAGLIAVIPVVLLSAIFSILKNVLFPGVPPLLSAAIYNFVVIALAEELVKYFAGRKTIDKILGSVSWLDLIVIMGTVGIAFGDWTAFIPVGLAIGELVLLIVFILFIRRARNDEKYTAPLFPEAAAE